MKRLDYILQFWRISKASRWIPMGARVLDIGCFDGAVARQCPQILSYIGVDPELPEEHTIPQKGDFSFYKGRFPEGVPSILPVTTIVALAVLEHVPIQEQDSFAQACFKLLEDRGRIIISVPSPFVDVILKILMKLRLLDGMEVDEHFGFDIRKTPELFIRNRFSLINHERFQLGLNHCFVFEKQENI